MRAFRVSKRLRFGLVAFYVFVILSPFLSSIDQPFAAQSVHAATQNANWIDGDNISLGGATYNNDRLGFSDPEFVKTGTCSQEIINLKDSGTKAELYSRKVVHHNATAGIGGGSPAHDTCEKDSKIADVNIKAISKDGSYGTTSSTLIVDGKTYKDVTNDTTYEYTLDGKNNSDRGVCVDVIKKDSKDDKTATLIAMKLAGTGGLGGQACSPRWPWYPNIHINIKNNSVAGTDFTFKDSNTILSSDGKDTYVLQPNGKYVLKTSDNCPADIVIKPGTSLKTPTVAAKRTHYDSNSPSRNNPVVCTISSGNPVAITIANVSNAATATPAPSTNPDTAPACPVNGAVSFIFCPIIDLADHLYQDALEPAVESLLNNGTLNTSDENVANAKAVWTSFKNMTNIFFVLVFIFVIFSNTLSIGLTNYDIKKMLPRLVVAVILVQFSWVLMQLAFDVSNILAAGIRILPVFTANVGAGGSVPAASWLFTGAIVGLFTVAIVGAALIIPFLLVILAAIIGILGVFLTLFIRQFIIIILVVVSPLAFVAWVLPNTESIFKSWSKMLLRLLFMYPLIVFIFSMAGLFSKIQPSCGEQIVNSFQHGVCSDINSVVAGIIPILAFYMVPMTFKWAGGAMAAVAGYVSGKASGWGKSARSPFNKEVKKRYAQHTANRAADQQLKAGKLFGKDTAISKLRAKAMTGNFGKRGEARLVAGSMKARDEQVKAERDKLTLESERLGTAPGFKEGEWLASIAGDTTGKYDDHQKQAAQEMMIDHSHVKELGEIAGTGMDSSLSWQRTKSAKFDSIRDKAGYLLEEGTLDQKLDKFARKVSKERMGTQKKDTLDRMLDFGQRKRSDTDPEVRAGVERMLTVAHDALGDQTVMRKVDGPEAGVIGQMAAMATPPPAPPPTGTGGSMT